MISYRFDKKAAEKVIQFIEDYCVQTKGEWAGKPLLLEKWQKEEIIYPLFGEKRPDGTRRYRTCYIEVPRKNGKSTLASAIGLYLLFADGEDGAEIYSAAADRGQAGLCFDIASEMITKSSSLNNRATVYRNSIVYKSSFYKAVSADVATKYGYNAHGIIFDELHVQPNRKLFDALQQSTAARRQPIMFIITTAGIRKEGNFAWEYHNYARQVSEKIIQDNSLLTVFYGAGEDDDIQSLKVWQKTNPNFKFIGKDYFKTESKKAIQLPSYLNEFKRFHLNIWTSSTSAFITQTDWAVCNKEIVTEENLKGKIIVAGLDLASSRDFTALVLLSEDFQVLPYFWIPKDSIINRNNAQQIYAWVRAGYITATPGNITDYNFIETRIKELAGKFNIREIAYDPWNSTHIVTNLIDDGANMIQFRQGFISMSPALKELERKILAKEINHGGNPVLAWMCDNMTIASDPAGNVKPDKEHSSDKIDGMVALIMAVSRMTFGEKEQLVKSMYEEEGFENESI